MMAERAHTSCGFCGRSVHEAIWLSPLPDGRLICGDCTGLMVAQVERLIAPPAPARVRLAA